LVSPQGAKETIIEKSSALFVEDDLVVALLDPPEKAINELAPALKVLRERMDIIIYSTQPDFRLPPSLEAERINMEKEKLERVKAKVLAAVRLEGKKMTDKAYALLKERVRDEALLDQELAKVISFSGEKKVIEAKDITAVVTETHEEDLISLSEAIAKKDRKQIMVIIDALLFQGMNLLAIHGFMTRHIGLLLQAKDAHEFLAGTADFRIFSKGFGKLKEELDGGPAEKRNFLAYQKPYYAYNLCKTSQKFSEETLLSFLDMLARFDRTLKKGTKQDRVNFETGLLGV
jgi:DNA polymerase III delta subunit